MELFGGSETATHRLQPALSSIDTRALPRAGDRAPKLPPVCATSGPLPSSFCNAAKLWTDPSLLCIATLLPVYFPEHAFSPYTGHCRSRQNRWSFAVTNHGAESEQQGTIVCFGVQDLQLLAAAVLYNSVTLVRTLPISRSHVSAFCLYPKPALKLWKQEKTSPVACAGKDTTSLPLCHVSATRATSQLCYG